MAGNIVGSTAQFTTGSMKPTSGEIGLSDWAQKTADNTGFNAWTPKCMSVQHTPLTGIRATAGTCLHGVYVAQGTYTVYARAYAELTGDYGFSSYYVMLDGTAILGTYDAPVAAGWKTGSIEIVFAADGWVDVQYTALGSDSSSEASIYNGAVYCQRTSR